MGVKIDTASPVTPVDDVIPDGQTTPRRRHALQRVAWELRHLVDVASKLVEQTGGRTLVDINDTVQDYREVAFQDCVTLLVRRIRTRIIA